MTVAGLAIDASNRTPIVLLRDPSGRRQVPIWVDHSQAHNIIAGINRTDDQRPLSHDLMASLIKAGNLNLDRVIINSIKQRTFQAVLKLRLLHVEKGSSTNESSSFIEVDARPSDAIALALRTKCSIWMLESVFASSSFPVDAEADQADQDEFRRFINEISPAALIKNRDLKDQSNEEPFDTTDSQNN